MPVKVFGAALAFVLVGTAAAQAQPGAAAGGGQGYRAAIAVAVQDLSRQIGHLQDTLINEPSARQGRGLYTQAEKASLSLAYLKKQLGAGASRADLAQAYNDVDSRLQALLGDIGGLGTQEKALHQAAARVRAADHELHFAVFGGDNSDARQSQVLLRQTLALQGAADDLKRTAQYLLAGQDSWPGLQKDFANLRQATDAFRQSLEGKADAKAQRGQFARVQKAWAGLAVDCQLLSTTNGILLQNYATRLDSIYGRLFGLMGFKGYRPSLFANS
jgi:hypothetical protein